MGALRERKSLNAKKILQLRARLKELRGEGSSTEDEEEMEDLEKSLPPEKLAGIKACKIKGCYRTADRGTRSAPLLQALLVTHGKRTGSFHEFHVFGLLDVQMEMSMPRWLKARLSRQQIKEMQEKRAEEVRRRVESTGNFSFEDETFRNFPQASDAQKEDFPHALASFYSWQMAGKTHKSAVSYMKQVKMLMERFQFRLDVMATEEFHAAVRKTQENQKCNNLIAAALKKYQAFMQERKTDAWELAFLVASPRFGRVGRVARRAQMLPALEQREDKKRKVYRVRSDSEVKEVSAVIKEEADTGVATDSLGIKAAALAVKACATAGNRLEPGRILAMSPQWISKAAHGRAFQEGEMELTALRIYYASVAREGEPPQQKPLLVGRTTNTGQLAGAVLRRIQELQEAVIHVAGPERIMAALRAVIAAQRLQEAQGDDRRVLVSPSWQSDRPGSAYLRLRCFIE
ncbi:unnamed protein product [Effrenium voratum]|nr:unnamed protein product [Effrenium voratum]